MSSLTNPPLKKLLLINQSLSVGGAETFLADLLGWFVQQGTQVHAVVVHPQVAELFTQAGISTTLSRNITDIVGNWKGLLKACWFVWPTLFEYRQFLRKHSDADGVLVSGFAEKILVSPLAALLKKKSIWIEFGPLGPLFTKFAGLPFLLYRSVKHLPEKIIVPTQHTKKHIIAEAQLQSKKIEIIPCGRAFLHEKQEAKKRAAAQILCISRLEPGKGQDLLIRALPTVLQKIPHAKLLIVGTGDFLPELKKLARELHVAEQIQFTGWVSSTTSYLQTATVAAFPSMWDLEGFGVVAIEAMAAGVPLVGFNRGPLNEIVTNNKDGLLVEPGNSDALARALIQLLSDSQLRHTLAKNARATVESNYTIEKVGAAYARALRQAFSN